MDMKKGERWGGCRFIHVCCDYGVCQNQMLDELGTTCDTVRCAEWISDHLIDEQDEHDELCEGCIWDA